MVKTERFRGRLMAGDRIVLESIEGLLKSQARSGGQGEWTGFFEYPAEIRELFVAGNRYRIVLIDGRSGTVALRPNDMAETTRPVANFHGLGTVRH